MRLAPEAAPRRGCSLSARAGAAAWLRRGAGLGAGPAAGVPPTCAAACARRRRVLGGGRRRLGRKVSAALPLARGRPAGERPRPRPAGPCTRVRGTVFAFRRAARGPVPRPGGGRWAVQPGLLRNVTCGPCVPRVTAVCGRQQQRSCLFSEICVLYSEMFRLVDPPWRGVNLWDLKTPRVAAEKCSLLSSGFS